MSLSLFPKSFGRGFAFVSLTFFLAACEPDVPVDARIEYWAGAWTCNETVGDFSPQTYSIDVEVGTGATDVTLSALYNQGGSFVVQGDVNGTQLTIPSQTVNGFLVSGSASYSVFSGTVTYQLAVHDGSSNDETSGTWNR